MHKSKYYGKQNACMHVSDKTIQYLVTHSTSVLLCIQNSSSSQFTTWQLISFTNFALAV